MSAKCEFSLVTVTGLVHYHAENRWSVVGQSRIGIYHNTEANSFRVVGRKTDSEHEVVANCPIGESFSNNYEQSTPTFHMWRDSTKVYGIKFYSTEDADLFAETIRRIAHTFDQLQQLIEDTNAMTMDLSSGALSEQPLHYQPVSPVWAPDTPSATPNPTELIASPVAFKPLKPVPPPPPPPHQNGKSPSTSRPVAIANNNKGTDRISQPKPAVPAGPSFLSEMELTLARRRAKMDALDENGTEEKASKEPSPKEVNHASSNGFGRKWSLGAPSHSTSPLHASSDYVSSGAFERLKEELLSEVRQELLLFKTDLIDAIKQQLSNGSH